jgi:hypothetical protein
MRREEVMDSEAVMTEETAVGGAGEAIVGMTEGIEDGEVVELTSSRGQPAADFSVHKSCRNHSAANFATPG